MARFVIRTVQVAVHGRGKNYYYPVEVRVMDTTKSEWHAVRGLNDGVKFKQLVCGTRYSGPNSQYGKALQQAKKIMDELEAAKFILA